MTIPQIHIGAGTQVGPLTVFPVWTNASGQLGISTGTGSNLQVTELASGPQVGKLSITNRGTKPALLLEGELLEGGHQHRVCAKDVILGVGERREVETFCVEQGRWGGKTSHSRNARRAPLSVRAELHAPANGNRQGRIWERVARYQGITSSSPTGSLVELLKTSQGLSQQVTMPHPLEGQRGIVLGLAGKVLMMELFGTHTLFLRHYRQFARSIAMDLRLMTGVAEIATPASAVRQFAIELGTMKMGSFGQEVVNVRSHGAIRSQPFSADSGHLSLAGMRVSLPTGTPKIAHLAAWNSAHSLMTSVQY